MEHQNAHADGDAQVDVFHLDRQRGGRLDQLAAILDAENQQHGEQEAADCMHRDAHDGAELFGHQILNESDGDVAAVAVDAGRAQEGGPDEQIARHLVGPAQGGEERAADDLRRGDDDHQAEHDDDGHAAHLIKRVADGGKDFLECHGGCLRFSHILKG